MTNKQKALLQRYNRCANDPRELQAFITQVIMGEIGDGQGLTEVTAEDVNSGEANSGSVLTSNGSGGAEWRSIETQVNTLIANGIPFLTTAPTSANTNGKLIVVLLNAEPQTRYDGYLYLIVGEEN